MSNNNDQIKELTKLIADKQREVEELLRKQAEADWTPTTSNVLEFIRNEDIEEDLEHTSKVVSFPNGWSGQQIHSEGGGEGDGEEYWFVFTLTKDFKDTKYFRLDGWYQSYNGSEVDWDDLYEAIPVEKTYTDYDRL